MYNKNVIAYAQTAEGRIVFTTPLTVYSESYITDHLGNVRATFRSNATGQVVLLQTNTYYPYGLRVNTSAYESTFPNEYFYQGKELDNENGLNWYNFHARMYDPILGRWHTPDPAQQYVSPYLAMGNDPVNRVDPDGNYDLFGWIKRMAGHVTQSFNDIFRRTHRDLIGENATLDSHQVNPGIPFDSQSIAFGGYPLSGITVISGGSSSSSGGSGGGSSSSSGGGSSGGANGSNSSTYNEINFLPLVFNEGVGLINKGSQIIVKGTNYITQVMQESTNIALMISKKITPALYTTSLEEGVTLGRGVSLSLQLNHFMRGETGYSRTSTFSERNGIDGFIAGTYGAALYFGNEANLKQSTILDKGYDFSVGYIEGIDVWWNFDKMGNLQWVGIKYGPGVTIGGSYGEGNTTPGWTGWLP